MQWNITFPASLGFKQVVVYISMHHNVKAIFTERSQLQFFEAWKKD